MAPKLDPESQIPHITESTCNKHVEQYWCENSVNFWQWKLFDKVSKVQNFDSL